MPLRNDAKDVVKSIASFLDILAHDKAKAESPQPQPASSVEATCKAVIDAKAVLKSWPSPTVKLPSVQHGVDLADPVGSVTKQMLWDSLQQMPSTPQEALSWAEAVWQLRVHAAVEPLYELGNPVPYLIRGKQNMSLIPITPPLPVAMVSNIPSAKVQSDAEVTWLEPQIKCPNCGSVVNGLADAVEELPAPRPTKFNQLPVSGVTTQQAGPAVMVWRSHPCNCKVSQEWAGAYAKEIQNRKTGGKPGLVQAMTSQELEAKKKVLEKAISNLMILKTNYENQIAQALAKGMPGPPPGELIKVERELVIKVNNLMQLCPGKHNKVQPTNLSQDTLAWASKNKLAVPPSAKMKLPQPSLAEIAQGIKSAPTGYEGQKSVVNPSQVMASTKGQKLVAWKAKIPPTLQTLPEGPVGPVGSKGVPGPAGATGAGVDPITGKPLPGGLVGAMPYALEFKIQMVDGPGVPKQGDMIVDEKGNAVGRVAHITTKNDGMGFTVATIQVIPVSTEVGGPKPGPSAAVAAQPAPQHPKDLTPAELLAKAKLIQQNILDHETKNVPLSVEAIEFLKGYGVSFKGSMPVAGPAPSTRFSGKVLSQQQLARDKFLAKAARKERPKIKRARTRKPGSGEGDG